MAFKIALLLGFLHHLITTERQSFESHLCFRPHVAGIVICT